MKKLKIILVIIAIIALGLGVKIVFFPVKALHTGIDMGYDIMEQTLDAENAIYNYEWFLQTAEDIIALNKKEKRAEQSIQEFLLTADDSREDKNELARLRAIKTGLSNMLDDTIAKYNARSKMANRAIFKDNLPSNMTRSIIATIDLIN